jgi:hypothetical protein
LASHTTEMRMMRPAKTASAREEKKEMEITTEKEEENEDSPNEDLSGLDRGRRASETSVVAIYKDKWFYLYLKLPGTRGQFREAM